jgi:hypothetical protein
MKIAVVGNCQMKALASAFQTMIEGAEVKCYFLNGLDNDTFQVIRKEILDYNYVFIHPTLPEGHPLSIKAFDRLTVKVQPVPPIVFSGFHPDTTLIPGFQSAAGNYHSTIVVLSYLHGLTWRRASKLFNSYLYAHLGYFNIYESARKFVLRSGEKCGLDLSNDFKVWEELGIFMHTINHPHMQVLTSLARTLAVSSGLVDSGVPVPELSYDYMAAEGAIWPVYPEIVVREQLGGL